jgi:uncharacterized membrane protein
MDWLALLVRWLHVVAGIAWIGASFYFVWLDNHLQPVPADPGADPEVAGELWAVHGGGFYRSRKYLVAPATLPTTLHWFYWEAYTTWLSGFALLCLLYFFQAQAYLIDSRVMVLGRPAAISIVLATLAGSWLIYDGLCRSPLRQRLRTLAVVIGACVAALAWGLCQVFSGRGAYMVFGAALGGIMVANVLFVIIPGQRELVRAKQQGRKPDPAPGMRGKQRSVHNTYFTLPVLFVMIGPHYPMTFSARYNWLVLIAISLAGACLRAWFVLRHQRSAHSAAVRALPAAIGLALLAGVILALAPPLPAGGGAAAASAQVANLVRIRTIIGQRCAPCHAQSPTEPGFNAPPNGVLLETPDQVLAQAGRVREQVWMQNMPLGNLSGMTAEERALLLAWLDGVRQ